MHWAVWTQNLDSVRRILAAKGTNVNALDKFKWSSLHLACCSSKSQLWETTQLRGRGLNSYTGPGVDLTKRPGALRRYSVLANTRSRSTGYGSEIVDKSALAEYTVAFFIALEFLQSSADVRSYWHYAHQYHVPLHCAASSGWTDHVDALLHFGASVHNTLLSCSPVCYVLHGTTFGHPMVLEYLKKCLGPACWDHARRAKHQCGASLPPFTWPTSGFRTWFFDRNVTTLSMPALPGAAGVIRFHNTVSPSEEGTAPLEEAINCALCRGISVSKLLSPTGYLHAESYREFGNVRFASFSFYNSVSVPIVER